MSARVRKPTPRAPKARPGSTVRYKGQTFTVWSLHQDTGWRWIMRAGQSPIPVRLKDLDAAP